MPAKNRPPIGHVNCRYCGERCSVHQQESKNAFFYTRFCSCDPAKPKMTTLQNKLKNPEDQQYILDNIELMEGQEIRTPPHLAVVSNAPKGNEWRPEEELRSLHPETEPSTDPEPEPKKGGKGWLFGGLGLAFLTGIGLIIKGVDL